MAEKKRGPGRPKGSKNKRKTSDDTVAVKSGAGTGKESRGKTGGSDETRKSGSGGRNGRRDTKSSKTSGKESKKNDGRDSRERQREPAPPIDSAVKQTVAAVVLLAAGVFLVLSIQTSVCGIFGVAISTFFKGVFGLGAYFLPYIIIIYGIMMFAKAAAPFRGRTVVLIIVLFLMVDLINSARFIGDMKYGILGIKNVFADGADLKNGGVFGMYAGHELYQYVGMAGLYLIAVVVALICILLLVNTPMSRFIEAGRSRRMERKQRQEEEQEKRDSEAAEQLKAEIREYEANGRMRNPELSAGNAPFGRGSAGDHVAAEAAAVDDFPGNSDSSGRKNADWRKNTERLTPADMHESSYHHADFKMDERKKKIIDLVKNEVSFGKGEKEKEKQLKIHIGDEEQKAAGDSGSRDDFNGFVEDSRVVGSGEPAKKDEEFLGFKKKDENKSGFAGGVDDISWDMPPAGAAAAVIGGASVATAASETEKGDSAVKVTPGSRKRYKLPPLDLLNPPKPAVKSSGLKEDLTDKATLLEQTLTSFNVDAKVVNVISGPSVTRYEIEPARGVKVQSITRLADDIALNMRAKSIRIEAPIPGKAAVGIEIENESRQMVGFREIVGSAEFRNHKSKLSFTVGRDISGKPVVADLGKMPHLLIAGATGSGKSVCINTIIGSILYKARPEEVKMLLIDPKMVELGNYNGIPHLLIPVVTDSSKAASALNWAVAEMTDRYKKFAAGGVRDIGAYNKVMKDRGEKEEILPQIVIIIDELADLMMVASSQVEDSICRLAQLARAAGMHLVVATQRPSVDVITGLIKANVPSRIAFMVSSQIDSRTIIDMPGAEKLVGNGDMLFKPQDLNKPKRIQGPYIDDGEVERLIEYVKAQSGEPEYNEDVIDHIESGKSYSGEDEDDELMTDAVEMVVSAGQASVSMLQRRFRIGYNRAARIVDMMEARGIIGPQDGSRPRQVLMTEAELEDMKGKI